MVIVQQYDTCGNSSTIQYNALTLRLMMIYEQTEFVFELFFVCFNLWYRRRQQETLTENLNLTMTLALNARIEYFDWTPRPMIV